MNEPWARHSPADVSSAGLTLLSGDSLHFTIAAVHKETIMSEQCPIWKTECEAMTPDEEWMVIDNSPRAGGSYQLRQDAWAEQNRMTEDEKARLTTILVRARLRDDICPVINLAMIDEAKSASTMPVSEKLDNLLLLAVDITSRIGEPVAIESTEPSGQLALAYTESIDFREVKFLADGLVARGQILAADRMEIDGHSYAVQGDRGFLCFVTVAGHIAAEKLQTEDDPI